MRSLWSTRRIVLAMPLAILALVLAPVLTALAYGNQAVYQIGLSFNCQNPTLCVASPQNPFGIGGVWGWIELDADGTGDVESTGQGHDNANPALNGVFRVAGDVTWSSDGQTLTIILPGVGPISLPAAPGHYELRPAPGINNELQVNLLR
jgi:hypothetical protein